MRLIHPTEIEVGVTYLVRDAKRNSLGLSPYLTVIAEPGEYFNASYVHDRPNYQRVDSVDPDTVLFGRLKGAAKKVLCADSFRNRVLVDVRDVAMTQDDHLEYLSVTKV